MDDLATWKWLILQIPALAVILWQSIYTQRTMLPRVFNVTIPRIIDDFKGEIEKQRATYTDLVDRLLVELRQQRLEHGQQVMELSRVMSDLNDKIGSVRDAIVMSRMADK